jgi:hypothetical protein
VNSGSIDVGHHTRFEIIDRRHDLQLPGPREIGEERAPQPQALGRPPSALLGRIVYEVPRLALNGDGRWQDWVDHPANRAGVDRVLSDDVAGRLTAPQLVCASTTTSGEPSTAAPYTAVPTWFLPAE